MQGAGVVALAGLLQHVANVDAARCRKSQGTSRQRPSAPLTWEARLVGGGMDGQQVDVATPLARTALAGSCPVTAGSAARATGRGGCPRSSGQRLAVVLGNVGRREALDPGRSLLAKALARWKYRARRPQQRGRDAALYGRCSTFRVPGWKPLAVSGDGGGEPAVLRLGVEGEGGLVVAVEEIEPARRCSTSSCGMGWRFSTPKPVSCSDYVNFAQRPGPCSRRPVLHGGTS